MIRRSVAAALAFALVLFTYLFPVTVPAHAAVREAPVAAVAPGAVTNDSWVGVASAIGCGLFIKATIVTGGTSAGTWAGAISSCLLTFLDALFEPD